MRVLRKAAFLSLVAVALLAELGCGDQYRPVANPVITPGGQPQHTHFAWVVNFNPNGDGSVTELDVSGDTNLAVNLMGKGTTAEAFPTSSLSLYVANGGDDTVMQFLPTLSGAITTVTLPAGSHPIALTSTTNTAMYVLNSGLTASACPTSGSISTINATTLSVTNTTCVGVNPTAFSQAPSNGFIYILNQGDSSTPPSISVFNPAGPNIQGTITSGLVKPVGVAVNAQGYAFIVDQGDGVGPGTLDIISPGTATISATASLGVLPVAPFIDPNRNRLYVPNSGDKTVSVFDATSVNPNGSPQIALLATAPVGTQPIGVTALLDGSNFYVANAGSNDVSVLSQNSFSLLSTVPLPAGANPTFIASDPTSQRVYTADQGTSETTIIQTSNNTVAQNIPAPAQNPTCTTNCALQTPLMIVAQ